MACDGAGNILNTVACFKIIPFLKEIIENKLVVALFDFDNAGIEEMGDVINSYIKNDVGCFKANFKNKEPIH